MLRLLKNNRAQVKVAEYMFVLAVIIAAASAMTVYFRRAIQAKIRDADLSMVATAINRTGPHYQGNWLLWYEPYYVNTTSTITRDDTMRKNLRPSTFVITYNTSTAVNSYSDTASPRHYLENIPTTLGTSNGLLPLP